MSCRLRLEHISRYVDSDRENTFVIVDPFSNLFSGRCFCQNNTKSSVLNSEAFDYKIVFFTFVEHESNNTYYYVSI